MTKEKMLVPLAAALGVGVKATTQPTGPFCYAKRRHQLQHNTHSSMCHVGLSLRRKYAAVAPPMPPPTIATLGGWEGGSALAGDVQCPTNRQIESRSCCGDLMTVLVPGYRGLEPVPGMFVSSRRRRLGYRCTNSHFESRAAEMQAPGLSFQL